MKKNVFSPWLIFSFLILFTEVGLPSLSAQDEDITAIAKYLQKQQGIKCDETKIPKFTLPDPLICEDGSKVQTAEEWYNKRRPELLALFKQEMYGQMPKVDPTRIKFQELTSVPNALDGLATRKEIRIFFNAPSPSPKMDLLVYIPNKREGKVPVFLGLNFQGNHATTDDPSIAIVDKIEGSRTAKKDPESLRGVGERRWLYRLIVEAGYAIATGYYEEIEPDADLGFTAGVHTLFLDEFPDRKAGDFPSVISAWAWGLSRALDCLETIPEIDAKKAILFGHSRLGKTSLWAGVNDTRFAAVISNDSGCGGAALSRRVFGENVETINRSCPHWFCANFKKYSNNENALPFDQHELIALIAPRPVYVASARADVWADPKGEFLSAWNADPVYRLLGTEGIGDVKEWPPVDTPVGKTIRYHLRNGKHDIIKYDWMQYIRFADELIKNR